MPAGEGVYKMESGEDWVYPASAFTGVGTILGRTLACLTPETVMVAHTTGYALDAAHQRDVQLLSERFVLSLPVFRTTDGEKTAGANRKTAVSDVFRMEPGTDPGTPKTERSPDERKQLLAQVVQREISKGAGRIESQSDYYVTLVRGHRPNHILHLILSIITFGVWLVVWILVAMGSGEKRTMVSVDEYGYVTTRRL